MNINLAPPSKSLKYQSTNSFFIRCTVLIPLPVSLATSRMTYPLCRRLITDRKKSGWRDSNTRPLRPERSTLPTALHPDRFLVINTLAISGLIFDLKLVEHWWNILKWHPILHSTISLTFKNTFAKRNGLSSAPSTPFAMQSYYFILEYARFLKHIRIKLKYGYFLLKSPTPISSGCNQYWALIPLNLEQSFFWIIQLFEWKIHCLQWFSVFTRQIQISDVIKVSKIDIGINAF